MQINGVEYERIPQPESKGYSGRKKLSKIMMMAAAMSYMNPYADRPKRLNPLPVRDIEAEFELIQRKESKLSRADRERVVAAFKRMYREVKK